MVKENKVDVTFKPSKKEVWKSYVNKQTADLANTQESKSVLDIYENESSNYSNIQLYDRCLSYPVIEKNIDILRGRLLREKNTTQAVVNNKKKNIKNDNLVIMLLNIRSIRKKLNELEIFIDDLNKKPHIIIITESWLREEEVKFFNLKNLQIFG